MNARTFLRFAVTAVAASFFTYWAVRRPAAEADDFASRRTALLEEENTRLRAWVDAAKKRQREEDDARRRAEIETRTAQLRGLDFKRPVRYEVLDRDGLHTVLERKLAAQVSDEEFRRAGYALSALGLLPAGYDLKSQYIRLLGEQIGAFFDQFEGKLYMFRDASLNNAQNRVILCHELVHALQDQHFVLRSMPLTLKNQDDLVLATAALIEGDATAVMNQYLLADFSLTTLKDTASALLVQNMEELAKAPRYLREMLVFPYLRGQEFCSALLESGGQEALDAAYRDLPSSSSQILHPEKYLATPREEPIRIHFLETEIAGNVPVMDNVLGEFGVRVLLSEWDDERAAAKNAEGWRGDRYLVFDQPAAAVVWVSVWESPEKAASFATALERLFAKRHAGSGRPTWVHARGAAVAACDAPDAATLDLLKRVAETAVEYSEP